MPGEGLKDQREEKKREQPEMASAGAGLSSLLISGACDMAGVSPWFEGAGKSGCKSPDDFLLSL
jgi:hypothetical protein